MNGACTCPCPSCREPTRYTTTADGVLLPTASPRVRIVEAAVPRFPYSPGELGISPMEGHEPPSWEEWHSFEGENV